MTATPANPSPPRGWVLYDGDCGFCSRWVVSWASTLARLGLGVAPLQAPWVAPRLGLDPGIVTQDIRLLFADGRALAGADVYRWVMRRLWWAFPFYLLAIAPGTRQLFDLAYRRFANGRMHFSRTCGLTPPEPR